jgi:TolB protein
MGNLQPTVRTVRPGVLTAVALGLALAAGCEGAADPERTTGAVRVSLSVAGVDTPNRYDVTVDGVFWRAVEPNRTLTVPGLSPGAHVVRLGGLAGNCSAAGGAERAVTVTAGREAAADFVVSCVARVGSLRVSTVTTGDEADADGYTVAIHGVAGQAFGSQRVGASASVAFTTLREGQYTVSLGDVAPNCLLVDPTSDVVRGAQVTFGGAAEITFTIECRGTGTLRVAAATAGVDPDPDGYTVRVARDTAAPLDTVLTAATVTPDGGTVFRLGSGSYRVTLAGVAANCVPAGAATRRVHVRAGTTTELAFALTCAPVTRLALVSERDGNAEIYAVNSNGTGLARLTNVAGSDHSPAWSPDGRRIAFVSVRHGDEEIYVMNADGSSVTRLTNAAGRDFDPAWSPDGRRIAFASDRGGSVGVWAMDADGANQVRLSGSRIGESAPAWSPDGARIAFTRATAAGNRVNVMSATGADVVELAVPVPPLGDGVEYSAPAWSPDGRRLAIVRSECTSFYYCSYYREAGVLSIVVVNADGSLAIPLAARGATASRPTWSPDGRAVAFAASDCSAYPCTVSLVYARTDDGAGVRDADLIVRSGRDASWRR